MESTVIQINNLKKKYNLGAIGGGTLSADLQSWWAKVRKREDPNGKIGQEETNKKTFWALNGLNIEIHEGEALGIIGSNGAGKSTLLKILSRVTAPTEGDVWIKGRISSMLEVGTGFHAELTGRENIYMNGAILGMSKREIDAKIEDIIEFSECRKFIDTPVKRYSSGMYVKLAFAVAAHLDAEIMVMDEVLAVGDMKFQEKCLGKMGDSAANDKKTILYVSHNMNTIRQLCTRCIVLDKGTIIFDGEVEQAIEKYMDNEQKMLTTFYDFTNTKRTTLDLGKMLFVKSFKYLDKESPRYFCGEPIKFKILWQTKVDVKNLRVYLPIKYADSSPVGLAESVTIGDTAMGEEVEVFFQFDTSNLAEGIYYFYVSLYTINEFGTHRSFDQPLQKIFFEIIEDTSIKSHLKWQRNFWGSVKFNDIKTLSIDRRPAMKSQV